MTLFTPNPFYHGNPVSPDHFIGRRKELRRIVNRLIKGESYALISEPRCGKTSLLEFIAAQKNRVAFYGEKGEKLLFTYLDAQTLNSHCTPAQFWKQALQPLEQVTAQNPPLSQAYRNCQGETFDAFMLDKLLGQMRQTGWQLVLIVDEFDELLHHPNLHNEEFFGSLRGLASRSRGALSLITASRRSLTYLNDATQTLIRTGSPYFNFMAELTLGPLSEKDTAKLLQRGKEYFLPQDYHFMKNVAAGHPYLLQVVASALWETYEDEEDDPTQRRQLAGEQLHQEITPTLNDIWRLWTPEMRKTFTTIALDHTPTLLGHRKFNSDSFLKSLGDFGQELRTLETQGFVIKDTELSSGYRIGPQVFVWWLSQKLTQVVRDDGAFNEWLQQQEIDGLLTKGQKKQLSKFAGGVTELFKNDTVAHLIEIVAKIF